MEETIDQQFPEVMELNIGGTTYTTRRQTLMKDKDSMLAALFSGRYKLPVDEKGRYFIDRDGKYFEYILSFLRDDKCLPPSHLALEVLNEAEYYQIRTLMKALETFPSVFHLKLEHARNEQLQVDAWKHSIVKKAQEKSLASLLPVSSVSFISSEDYDLILDEPSCVGKMHQILVTKQTTAGIKYSHETFPYLLERLKKSDCIIKDLRRKDLEMFVQIIQKQLQDEDYRFNIFKDTVTCKTTYNVYGLGKEACKFKLNHYHIEFFWE